MATSPNFWNWIAKLYAKQPVADEAAYKHKLEMTQKLLRPEMNVLEFGCGTGSTALLHAPYVKSIVAIDFSKKMIEIATNKAREQGVGNVSFQTGMIEDWPVEDRSFDVIFGLSILHLLEDKEAVLRKVHRLLKPGGVFVSSTVCPDPKKKNLYRFLAIGNALGVLPLVKPFSASELATSIENAGFSINYNWRPAQNKAVFIVAKAK